MSSDPPPFAAAPPTGRPPGRPPGRPTDLTPLAGAAGLCALGLLILGVVLLLLNLQRFARAHAAVENTFNLLHAGQVLEQDVLDAETGQRGYLLTGDARYLVPFERARTTIWRDFAVLQHLAARSEATKDLGPLRSLLEDKLAELGRTVHLRRTSYEAALAIVRTDLGQRLMDQIRRELTALNDDAEQNLQARWNAQQQWMRIATFSGFSCGLLGLVLAGIGARLVFRQRELRRYAEQNVILEETVRRRTAALEESNRELQAFGATLSHDLRTPVRTMAGYAIAVQEDAGTRLTETEREYLSGITDAAERADELINDILSYSQLADASLAVRNVSLGDVVAAALDQHREIIRATSARVEVTPDMPAVRAHPAALTQAIGNLLGNALKFTPPGVPPWVRVRAEERPGGRVRLWVEDAGIGIPAAQHERIFRPFERLHGRDSYAGTGIGLAVVRRVAERLGGDCGVFSNPGKGSRFWLELPAWQEGMQAAPAKSEDGEPAD